MKRRLGLGCLVGLGLLAVGAAVITVEVPGLLAPPAPEVAPAPVKPPPKRRHKKSGGTLTGSAPDAPVKLVMPAARPCLAGPSEADLQGDQAMVGSNGLAESDVREAMAGFVQNTLRCFPDVTTPGTIDLSITVGCNGRVSAVEVLDAGPFGSTVAGCVKETLGYAPFPAHDMPDGFAFEYPLTFTPAAP